MNTSGLVLEVEKVNKYFHDPVTIQVLKEVSMQVARGEFVSITGKSGCGKSTLLYILSTMDTDYEGELKIDGEPTRKSDHTRLARIRNEKIGFVFQFHYCLLYTSDAADERSSVDLGGRRIIKKKTKRTKKKKRVG